MTVQEIIETIERETGQKVTTATPIEDLAVDSLEFLDLLLQIGVPSDRLGSIVTVGDLAVESIPW